ncbi:flippase-like domain-containing protein [Actinoplanes subtropicus]|uniref:flippase-like domain-containing protein n=1 Tax=Actinoplanes subtropicus TaxID=543632 RepID=UPI0007C4E572|nr:flippase-like domain-containing protein [Actinoplanes subtropicus]
MAARRRLRVAAVALTLAMDATVVLTANHYILDGIAGAALAGVAWHLAGRFHTTSAGPRPAPARHRANLARHRSKPARHRAGFAGLGGDAAGPLADFAGIGGAAALARADLARIGGAAALPHIDLAGLRGDAAGPRAKSAGLRGDAAGPPAKSAGLRGDAAGPPAKSAGLRGDAAGPRAKSAGPRTKLAGPCAKHTGTRAMPATPRTKPARPAATGVAQAGGSVAARASGADASATVAAAADGGAGTARARTVRRLLPRIVAGAVVIVLAVELALGWSSLTAALAQIRAPRPGWLAAGLALEIAAMSAYARMQRRLLRSAGVRAPLRRHIALAYAAHSLSVTLPGGAAFSTRLNYQQMRRFGAGPAVATWAIAFSGILSTAGLALVSAASAVAAGGTPQWRTLVGLTLAGVLLVLGIRWITANPDRLEPVARAGLVRVNRLLRRPRDHGIDQVRGFVDQLRAARLSPGHGAAAIGHSVLNWLFDAAALWMCLRAVSDDLPRGTQVLLAFCAGMAAGGITIVPGGLGIIDSALIVALVATGAGSATAIAAVVLYRILTLGFIVGTGWIAWLAVRRQAGTATLAQPGPVARSAVDQPSPRPAPTPALGGVESTARV